MNRKELMSLVKLLDTILAVRPDEFGLMPDPDGFIPIKELFQSLREEGPWSWVNRGHLMEILHSPERSRFEMDEKRIRATFRRYLVNPDEPCVPPKRLYHGVRKRAHAVVLSRGLHPTRHPWVVLATTRDMALRIAKRRDPEPVLLEVRAQDAAREGVRFFGTMERLVCAEAIPAGFLVGPPAPRAEKRPPAQRPKPAEPAGARELPGSFFLDPERDLLMKPGAQSHGKRRRSRRQQSKSRHPANQHPRRESTRPRRRNLP